MYTELTQNPVKNTLKVAWPAMVESFFVTMAGIIDTIMVSELGPYAISSIGLTNQPKFLGLTLFFCLNTAVAAFSARRKGQEDKDGANDVFITSILYALFLTLILSIVFVYFADDLMRLVGSNADTHEAATSYFKIVMGGMFFNVMTMLINSALRGIGNTRVAMTSNVIGTIVNIAFNFVFITGRWGFPALGVTGAAIATVLSTVVSLIVCIVAVMNPDAFISVPYIRLEKLRPTWKTAKALIKFQNTTLIQFIGFRIGFMVTAVMAARLGTDEFAIHMVGMNLLNLGFAFGDGLRIATVSLTGQSLGAGLPDLAKRYGKIAQAIGFVLSLVLAIIMLLFGDDIFMLFFRSDRPDNLQAIGRMITYFIMVVVVFQVSQVINSGALQAAGDLRYNNIVSLVSVGVIRTIVTYVLVSVLDWGLRGIWFGVVADQFSRCVALGWRFWKYDFHKAKKL
jgi:putative MATE family efflux protein